MGEQWKVGDSAVVVRHGISESLEFRLVARVMKRFVELDDGSKWDHSWGHHWPRSDGYGGPHIRHEEPGDRDLAKRANLAARIREEAHAIDKSIATFRRKKMGELPDADALRDVLKKLKAAHDALIGMTFAGEVSHG